MSYDVQISLAYDEKTKQHALAVFVAPFPSREQAEKYADRIKEFLEQEASGTFGRVQ